MRLAVVAIAVVASEGRAHATYSIVATDAARGEVGGAGTSCVGTLSVRVIYGSVPGKGAVHAQAQLGGPGRDGAVMRLAMEVAPAEIIAQITSPAFDANAQRRQYGVVDLQRRADGFTGANNGAFAADRQGVAGAFTYSVQGNILTSVAVIDQATGAFAASGCDLADRLMLALEAGARNGEGDSRCTPAGIPSDSAFIEVDRMGEAAGAYLRLEVTDTAPQSPLVMLRAQYDAWRATHPCPAQPPDAGPGGGPDAGEGGDPDDPAAGCCSSGAGGGNPAAATLFAIAALLRRRAVRSRR